MTNSEAIKQLIYVRRNLDEYLDEDRINAVNNAISALEENTKLKTEIEQFSNELISVLIENELLKKKNELTNYYFEQYAAAIDEIEQAKAELEQATNLMPKICETCEYEDEIGWKEPCSSCKNSKNWKLKSEVSE